MIPLAATSSLTVTRKRNCVSMATVETHRPDCKQILLGLAVDRDGLPLGSDVFPGNTQDVETVQQMVTKIKGLGIQRCIFVSDCGMVSKENLDAMEEAGLETLWA